MKVAVVVTCYNYGKYLPFALDSVLAQTHRDLEVVVVNDGSTDDTDAVARRYLSDPRVKYLARPNGGQAAAKNAGIRATTADLIAFLDADDVWVPAKLEKQLPLFSDPAVGVVYSRMGFIGDDGRPPDRAPWDIPAHRGNVLRPLLQDNFVAFSSSVVRRACFDRLGLFDETLPMAIDWDLWLRFATEYRFDHADEVLLLYREGHPGQMSRNRLKRFECCDRIFEHFVETHRARLRRADVRDARTYTFNSRGHFFRATDPRRSLRYYARSLKENPLQWTAARGLALSALHCLGPRRGPGEPT